MNEGGVYRTIGMSEEYACYFPLYITRIFENIDDGTRRVELYFKTPTRTQRFPIKCSQYATPKELVKLADMGLGINLRMAQVLSDYLNDVYALNQSVIPCLSSVGRLGWINEKEFSPYLQALEFDGADEYAPIFRAVREHGSEHYWTMAAQHFRTESRAAHIVMAASFASVLVKPLGLLPFFVHLWGIDSSTGKTVALMAAASVWANPEMGKYVKTFDGTDVGYERTAAFLNSLPMCIDELQLAKDKHGKPLFNVYRLAQGAGRTRGNKGGGVEITPTWQNATLTTGETPLTTFGAGAGAVNRVIEIECTSESKVVNFGHEYAQQFRENYGFAGKYFVNKLLEPGALEKAREYYNAAFEKLNSSETTDKQAMAAALIVAADKLATDWIFHDGHALEAEDIGDLLADREAVSTGARGYQHLSEWVAMNSAQFEGGPSEGFSTRTYGRIAHNFQDDYAYIVSSAFNDALQEGGFDPKAVLSYLRTHQLIKLGAGSKSTVTSRIGGSVVRCVALKLQNQEDL